MTKWLSNPYTPIACAIVLCASVFYALGHKAPKAGAPRHYFFLYEVWSYAERNDSTRGCASITHYPLADENGKRPGPPFDDHWEAFRENTLNPESKSFATVDAAKAYVESHWCITVH